MIITNPRTEYYPQLHSFTSTEHREPSKPKMKQVHGNRVVIVTSHDQDIGEADGMVTSLKNLELQVRTSDCGNIYAYDPVAELIGLCHSGRQGTRLNIIENMISSMVSLGSKPHNIRIRTGPCIGCKNYKFGPEVRDFFEDTYYKYNDYTYYLDLPKIHHDQLTASGILAQHIVQSDICTFQNLELPSYRRDGPDQGRLTGSIMLAV